MVPKARRPRQARVRLPHFPSLGQRAALALASLRKAVTYHSIRLRANDFARALRHAAA